MKNRVRELVLLPLVLGCATQAGDAQATNRPAAVQASASATARPLRFGDPTELAYDEPFFPGARYDGSLATPDSILGQPHGTRLSHHAEILACFRAWAASSKRIRMETFARTHEGRELVWAAISSPANLARLDAIRADMAKLS